MENPCRTCRFKFFDKNQPNLIRNNQGHVVHFLSELTWKCRDTKFVRKMNLPEGTIEKNPCYQCPDAGKFADHIERGELEITVIKIKSLNSYISEQQL